MLTDRVIKCCCRPSSVPCSPSVAARRQLPLDGRLPAIEDSAMDSGTPDSSSSGSPPEAANPEAGDRSAPESGGGSAAAGVVDLEQLGTATMPPPDDDTRLSNGKLPAVAAPARIEIQVRAGGSWQAPHSDAVDRCSLPSADGPAGPVATALEQRSSVATALPSRTSPEPHSPLCAQQAAVSGNSTEPPSKGRAHAEPRRGPLARAMSLREAYGGTPLGQEAAAANDLQSSSLERGGAPLRTASATGHPSSSDSVACILGEMPWPLPLPSPHERMPQVAWARTLRVNRGCHLLSPCLLD